MFHLSLLIWILKYLWQCDSSTGLDELEDSKELSLYPNPTHSVVNILSDGEPLLDVLFFDLEGRCVRHEANDRSGIVDVSTLPAGFYMAQIRTVSGLKTRYLIVQR